MRGAIIDMDGTLVDSMKYWNNKLLEKLDSANIDYPDNILSLLTPIGVKPSCEYLHDELGHPKTADELYDEIEREMYADYESNIGTKPFVMEFLEKLKSQGVKMCILSASTQSMIEASAKHCGYDKYMEFVMSCEDVGKPKSAPDTYLITAEKLGVPIEDITVYDDHLNALQSAKKAGATVIGVHDISSEDDKEEIIKICDKYIYSFNELL